MLAGPYGKYLLEDCFHPEVQVVVFEYLDLLGLMWEKTITGSDLRKLECRLPIVLTMMEVLLPAWELDLNRHHMVHLVAAIRANGPCWVWAMFGFERFWKHLTDWMTEVAEQLLADEEHELWEGHGAQSVSTAFSHDLQTFDHQTNELILPSFLQTVQGVSIQLADSHGFVPFGFGQHPDPNRWRAELHLYYLQFPELCKACTCCSAYDALWKRYLQAEVCGGHHGVTKQRLPGLLDQWYVWGKRQPQLCQHGIRLCYGPKLSAEVFDRATIQGVPFSTTKTEGMKRSRESVVLMKDNNKYWAGRVCFFLSHTPPGVDVSKESGVYIAHVKWYNHLPQGQNMSATLNCPIFKTSFKDDKGGNMWPVEKLAP